MRTRILKTLAMLGLSACLLVGSAVSGFAADAANKDTCPKSKDGKHEWKITEEWKEDCVPTDFSLDGKTITLCPHCGKEGKTDPVERLSEVKFAFSNYSNIKVYKGSLKNGKTVMTVAFYNSTYIQNAVCAKCGKVENLRTTAARVMDSDTTTNIELPVDAVKGYSLLLVNADGTKTPIDVNLLPPQDASWLHHARRGAGALRRPPSALWLGARPAGHRGRALRRHAAAAHPCRQRYHRRPDGQAGRAGRSAGLSGPPSPKPARGLPHTCPTCSLPPPGRWRGGAVLHRCGCSWWKCTSIPPGIPPAFCPPGGIRLCGSTLARRPTAGTGGACSTPACAAPPAAATPPPPKTTSSAGSTFCGSSAWKRGRDGPPAAGTRSSSAAVKSRPFPALHKLIVEGV